MTSILLGSFPIASSYTTVGSCWRKSVKSYHARSYVTKAAWHEPEKIQNEYPIVRHQQHKLNLHYRGIEAASACEESAESFVVNAANAESFESAAPQDHSSKTLWGFNKKILNTFYRFTRPYVMLATAINLTSVALLSVEKSSDISMTFFIGLLKAMLVIIPMNFYVIGVNDLADVEIDKINKPYLPSASGDYSLGTVSLITVSSLILSYVLGWTIGSPALIWAISAHFLLGSAYSINLPLLRWKRSTLLTAMYFVIDRAIILQLALFHHMQKYVFKRTTILPKSLIFATVFMSCLNTVIAISKDIPDIEGDEKFGIRSLAVRLGKKRVFSICVFILEMTYGASILLGLTSSSIWNKLITGLGHAVLASILWFYAKSINLESRESTQSFYLFIWKLFVAEFFLVPFVR